MLSLQGEARLPALEYGEPGADIRAGNAHIRWMADGISRTTLFQTIHSSLDIAADRLLANSLDITKPEFHCAIQTDSTRFEASALLDSVIRFNVLGMARYVSRRYELAVDQFGVSLGPNLYQNAEQLRMIL